MKKYFSIMVAVALGLVATVSLAACGGDDDDSEAKKAAYAEAEYSVVFSEDILKYYNVEVNYLGYDGKKVENAQVQNRNWKGYKGSSKTLPVTFFYKFNFTEKADLPKTINLAYNSEVTISVFNKDGKKLRSKKFTSKSENTGLDSERFAEGIKDLLNDIQFSYVVPADGTLKDIEK